MRVGRLSTRTSLLTDHIHGRLSTPVVCTELKQSLQSCVCLKSSSSFTGVYARCANKKWPFKTFYISVIVIKFLTKLADFISEDSGHICSKFRYNIWFGLKITAIWIWKYMFVSVQVIKLRLWCKITSANISISPLNVWSAMLERYQRYMPKLINVAQLKIVLLTIWNDRPWSSSARQSYNFAADFDRWLLQTTLEHSV